MTKTQHRPDDTFLALDIGGTNVTSGLVDRVGKILQIDGFSTGLGKAGPKALTDLIVDHLKLLWNKADSDHRPLALAIGAPGWLKPHEGVVVVAPNLPGWRDVPITRIMSQALDLPAKLENDANLYALGEWLAGAGQGHRNEITLTLGTGVGGGLILNDRLWSGSFASAAEIGHIPLGAANTDVCGCGRQGCLETIASARGMARQARLWLAEGKPTIYEGSPDALDTQTMVDLAHKGDQMSLQAFNSAGEAIGQILTGVFNLLSLEAAVIGGGAAGAFDYLKGPILKVLGTHLVTAQLEEISVVKGQLGLNAPLVGGAALLAAEGY
ncbi:MAG: ROK family protein [Deltaproteobacteria bacterium]|jgi:glucokinase|nr:ROK family protein [Deltaproteobacteria bacterium]